MPQADANTAVVRVEAASVNPSDVKKMLFEKGNATLRGSTGPLGMFLGTTSIGYAVKLTDQSHRVLFDAHMKDKHRLDTQSLGLAQQVAGNVSKQLNKGMKSTSSSHV
jgi:hypothetical protein